MAYLIKRLHVSMPWPKQEKPASESTNPNYPITEQ